MQIRNGIAAALGVAALAAGILLPVFDGGSINDVTIGELVVPRGSPFWFSYEGEYDGGSAHIFVGDFVVSGTYYYGYDEDRTPTLFIVPDAASAAVLPYWKRWGPAKRIDLTNADDFAKAALPRSVID